MRVIEQAVYEYHELSAKAQQRAQHAIIGGDMGYLDDYSTEYLVQVLNGKEFFENGERYNG